MGIPPGPYIIATMGVRLQETTPSLDWGQRGRTHPCSQAATKMQILAILAREVSLILANMPFPPSVIHTPGIANVLADKLSRLHDGKNVDVLKHPALAFAKRVFPAQRKRGWYRTLKKFRG